MNVSTFLSQDIKTKRTRVINTGEVIEELIPQENVYVVDDTPVPGVYKIIIDFFNDTDHGQSITIKSKFHNTMYDALWLPAGVSYEKSIWI